MEFRDYVGIPWVETGETEDGSPGFNCWTFFKHIQQEHFGRDVGNIGFDVTSARGVSQGFRDLDVLGMGFAPCRIPEHGGGVVMFRGSSLPHVGTWIVDGRVSGVLHCQQGFGVTFSRMDTAFARMWSRIQYYKWVK